MFEQLLKRLEKTEWMSEKDLRHLQHNAVNQIVRHHREKSPWYKKLTQDSKSVPIITKRDIQQAGEDFFSVIEEPTVKVKTSGSTGEPLEIKSPAISSLMHNAFTIRNLRWNFDEENLRSSIIKANIDSYQEL